MSKESKEWVDPENDKESTLMLDVLIDKLTEPLRKKLQVGTKVNIHEGAIKCVINMATELFKQETPLLELEAPINVTGDFHGQFYDLLRIMDLSGGFPPEKKYLCMGDFVDRGKQSIETVTLLLAYKVRYPKCIFMLRGNHECASVTRMYGFHDECKRRYSIPLWNDFVTLFNYLPIAAVIDERILCMHGGLSPEMNNIE